MGRAPRCEKNNGGLKKGPWTKEEDQKLTRYIQTHGPGNWRILPKSAGLERFGKSCRLRWTNYLRPDIKRGRFSFEEEEAIIQLHSVLGDKWSAIAARLPGRTDNEIKNYWNTHIRKRFLRNRIDPVTHTPKIDIFNELTNLLKLSNPAVCNRNALLKLSHLLSLNQPQYVNPQLLNLASTLLTFKQQQQQSPDFLPLNTLQMQNLNNLPQFQQMNGQQFQIYPLNEVHAQQLVQGGINNNIKFEGSFDINSKLESLRTSPLSSYETKFELTTSSEYLGDQSIKGMTMLSNGTQPTKFSNSPSFQSVNNSNQQQQYSFKSGFSTPNHGQCTDEEIRDTYCSNLFNFEIPEGLDMSYLL